MPRSLAVAVAVAAEEADSADMDERLGVAALKVHSPSEKQA